VAGRRHTRSELKDASSEIGDPMIDNLHPAEYDALLRQDFETFAARCFHDLNPQTQFSPNWHIEVIAAKLMAVRQGKLRRLIINLPPRSLKSLLASVAFPAWYLGQDPSAQLLCVSYAQPANKINGLKAILGSV
jgi:hypothetical protein